MPRYPESQVNTRLTATLPAWVWRRVLYAVEAHAASRRAAGYDVIGDSYETAGERLAAALGVGSSGDLPVGEPVYDRGR